MRKIFATLSVLLCLCLLTACAGTPVIYHINCDCPGQNNGSSNNTNTDNGSNNVVVPEGALKTGLAIDASVKDSKGPSADKAGEGKYDITMVAVLVDDNGVIQGCIIDGVSSSVNFDAAGKITSDLTKAPQTKNELGDAYNMVLYGGAKYEWYKQAEALANFAVGKTVTELKNGAVDETGKAPAGSDLASQATIYLGGYVATIEKAVANATHLGAMGGDTLKLASSTSVKDSKDAGEKNGETVLEVTSTALTVKDGVITSCAIDSVQAKVSFDATGKITSDLTAAIKTKNELGAAYNMVLYGGAIAEWNEQAASFAKYVTGKTLAQVKGIAVDNTTKPTGADLTSSVTIAIGGFQAIIEKALQ